MDSRKHGYLSVNDVRKLLIRMGNPVPTSAYNIGREFYNIIMQHNSILIFIY